MSRVAKGPGSSAERGLASRGLLASGPPTTRPSGRTLPLPGSVPMGKTPRVYLSLVTTVPSPSVAEEGRPLSPAPPAVATSGNRKPGASGLYPSTQEEQEGAGRPGLGQTGHGPLMQLTHPHLLLPPSPALIMPVSENLLDTPGQNPHVPNPGPPESLSQQTKMWGLRGRGWPEASDPFFWADV